MSGPSDPPSPSGDTEAAPKASGVASEAKTWTSTFLRQFASVMSWFTGSLAGLGVILYGFGYLVTLSNLHMIGLDAIALRYDWNFYIQRGSDFVLITLVAICQVASEVVLAFILIVIWLLLFLRGIGRRHRRAGRRRFNLPPRAREFMQFLGWLLLFVPLITQAHNPLLFPDELGVSDVLYGGHAVGPRAVQVLDWIKAGRSEKLHDMFSTYAERHALIAVLLMLAWLVTASLPLPAVRRLFVLLPFMVAFLLSFAWLPLEYGKLMLPNAFQEVRVTLEHAANQPETKPGMMFLLAKTDNDFTFWQPGGKLTVWLPARNIASVEYLRSVPFADMLKRTASVD